jgi:murein DD-endopeptidase MepM/ murein hydrolase activator NlpD
MNRSGARLGAASALCISAGLVLSGCSTDTSRFDFPVLGVQQDPAPNQTTGTLPRERQRYDAPPPVDNEQIETAPNMRIGVRTQEPQEATPMSRTPSEVRVSNLPSVPAERQPVPPARLTMPQQSHDRKEALVQPTQSTLPAPVHQVHYREPLHVPPGGKIVEVGQGDTLYKLSRQHHVAISSIMTANHMQSPVIRQGQKLVIPPPENRARIPARTEQLASRTQPQSPVPAQSPQHTTVPPTQSAPKPTQQQTAPRPAPTITGDTYTVQAGESFYAIARRMGVRSDDLAKYNGITDLSKLRQGQVLKIPPAEVRTNAPPRLAVQSPTPRNLPPDVQRTVPPAVQQQPTETEEKPPQVKKVASLNNPQTKTEAISSTGFRWPVKGKIVGKFGPRTDGSHNDGIDIAVPLGTEVAAAEDGVIAYAGNELKGYGNLILIRHDDNWVSAYAHNEQMLVKRGDKVKRGQVIAKAGKSGNIEQPIVHFELRQGSKPVDPTKHLAAN